MTTPKAGNLDLDTPVTFDLFKIWTDETDVGGDDKVSYPIGVDFYFSEPAPNFSGGVKGKTYGKGFVFQSGRVKWDGASVVNFGPNGDGELLVSLSDETFSTGFFGTKPGQANGAVVKATFTLNKEASPVPEPATMLLGLGIVGIAGARRKFTK